MFFSVFLCFSCVFVDLSSIWPAFCYVVLSKQAELRKASSIVTEVTQTSWPNQHFTVVCASYGLQDGMGPPVIKPKLYRHKHKDK